MKKLMKRALALCLAVLMLAAFCGCTALDKAKENQAILQSDGSVVWNGVTYLALPYSAYLVVDKDTDVSVRVTEKDVPVLASLLEYQSILYPSEDRRFLSSYSYTGDDVQVYCQKPEYDAMVKRLQEDFTADKMGYFYSVWNEDETEIETKFQALTAAQVKMLTDVTANVEPQSGTQVGLPQALQQIYLYECSEDMLLQRCRSTLALAGNTYYLFLYEETDTLFFPIPEGCNAQMAEIFDGYAQATQEGIFGKPEKDY